MELTKQVKDSAKLTKPIVLVGFMACGKSTLGLSLARALGADFVDLDALVAKRARMPVAEVFARRGEVHFRRLETGALRTNLRAGRVLAAGGGLVTIAANLRALKQSGALVVWVDVSWAGLWKRLQQSPRAARPLLVDARTGKAKSEASVRRIWSGRRGLYGRASDFRLRVRDGEGAAETVGRLVRLLGAGAGER